MPPDTQRIQRIKQALHDQKWDAVVCTLPMNVLLLSGYWPFVGAAIAVATAEGAIGVLAPDDAAQVAAQGWADELDTFQLGSLQELRELEDIVRQPLAHLLRRVGLKAHSVIAYEDSPEVEPAAYAALNVYGAAVPRLLAEAVPGISLEPGSQLLSPLRAVLTQRELTYVREACRIVQRSFESGRASLCAGLSEIEIADAFRVGLSTCASNGNFGRRDGFVYCMSGSNSASAYTAYQSSTDRTVHCGDFVLVHCNSYVNGFWTDVTRTFCIGKPNDRQRAIYDGILEAHRAAIGAIRPGVRASEVDCAARTVLTERGFGAQFKHPTGHGVGFAAINHLARPRIHPKSDDILEPGMTFNIEPAIYVEGYGGARHCDVVTVTESGAEILTPFLEIL
jgi:Xaa-Pro aminopeptidase